jgi:hypothetical protein
MEVNGHSYKPEVRFFGKGNYHLGIELEVEAPTHETMLKGLNLLKKPECCYAKRDGSLSEYGWELVTQPIAWNSWLTTKSIGASRLFFKFVNDLREVGYSSHANGRCGLHIHVSLTAFRGVKEGNIASTHMYWFMRLINSDLFARLSQRHDSALQRWAKIRQVNAKNFHTRNASSYGARYTATNVTPTTCEVRLFRGNMREDRIRKAIESVIAAVEYSRGLSVKDFKEEMAAQDRLLIHKKFIQYVQSNASIYPNLEAFLVEIGQLPSKKEGAEVCA